MAVNLQKGQKVDLTKGNAGLKKVMVGLGWDEVQPEKGGFFSGLLGKKKEDIDCDAMAFLLDASGRIMGKDDVIFFGNLSHTGGCVRHMGDNLTGGGEGDDEQIFIDLANLPARYDKVVILVSIYEAAQRKQHFGMVQNAFIRLVDNDTRNELCIYNLTENYSGMVGMVFGEIYRHEGEWRFAAVGEGLKSSSVLELAGRYGLPARAWR